MRKGNWRVCLAFSGFLGTAGATSAAPPPGWVANPVVDGWFKSLSQPETHASCCAISDCRVTAYSEREGHFEVEIEGWPYVVPEKAVMTRADNPVGHAVVCYRYGSFGAPLPAGEARTSPQDVFEILCFVPSKPAA